MSRILRGTVLAGATLVTLLGAAPAHADDASYLAGLDARGAYRSGPPASRLAAGYKFCEELRAGFTPQQITDSFRANLRTFGLPSTVDDLRNSLPAVIDVAQHELCPDTLG